MNTDTSTIPIFFRLFESHGKPTDLLVLKIQRLADEIGVSDDVKLEHIQRRDDNPSQNILVYSVQTKPSRQRHSTVIGSFLSEIFKQFFTNHPSYTEPLTNGPVEATVETGSGETK